MQHFYLLVLYLRMKVSRQQNVIEDYSKYQTTTMTTTCHYDLTSDGRLQPDSINMNTISRQLHDSKHNAVCYFWDFSIGPVKFC